ncbi:winged helix DNA-binding domain-containing protein [Sanghuangporus baumii]|uniref:Winged helix DNA-binding domain-containing protein n=1 Tax=Sanghuangporus baumii TaxID=108892 RepID=A0A9Q5I0W2_SANBA|nr:winged helix DNA-binding domain-containing protein [Sanghuangporus baumii]
MRYKPSAWITSHPDYPGRRPVLVPASFHNTDTEDEKDDGRDTFDAHRYFGIPPGTPVCLGSLKDPPPGKKPDYPYAMLVKLAIYSSSRGKLTSSEIYAALSDRFSWFRERGISKKCIGKVLSQGPIFVKVHSGSNDPFIGWYWTVDLSQSDCKKCLREYSREKNSDRLEHPTSEPHISNGYLSSSLPTTPLHQSSRSSSLKEQIEPCSGNGFKHGVDSKPITGRLDDQAQALVAPSSGSQYLYNRMLTIRHRSGNDLLSPEGERHLLKKDLKLDKRKEPDQSLEHQQNESHDRSNAVFADHRCRISFLLNSASAGEMYSPASTKGMSDRDSSIASTKATLGSTSNPDDNKENEIHHPPGTVAGEKRKTPVSYHDST